MKVEVLNAQGNLMSKFNDASQTINIDTKDFKDGMYLIKVIYDDRI